MKLSEIIKLNDEQFTKQLDLFESIPKSRILSKDEEHSLRKSLLEYQYTLNKCKDGKIISAELQPIVDEFESANYNIDNLKPHIKNSLNSTYEELKYCIESDPKTFKNTTAKLYCDLYEMFKMNKAYEAINRMKNSKFFKGSKFARESFSIESLQTYIAENNGVQSAEGMLTNFFTKILHKSKIPEVSISIQSTMLLVSVLLLLVTIAVITLCIINSQYKSELTKILDKLADEEVKRKGALKCRQDNVKAAAINMEQNTPNITKQTLLKAAKYSIRQINGLSKADYSELDKSAEDFNRECNEIIAQSREGVVEDALVDASGKLYKKLIEFIANHKSGIQSVFTIAMIVGLIYIGIPLIRAAIYHFKSWRVRMSEFFNEENKEINKNIEEMIAKRDDPTTSQAEKDRLTKIINKQRVWIKNMTAWANLFYKSEIDAGSDTMYELRQDEKINFDEIARKQKEVEEKSLDEINETIEVSTTSSSDEPIQMPTNKPVVLF